MRLPNGQRALILLKLEDIVDARDPHLSYATAEFLELLIIRGLRLGEDEYEKIALPALKRAFDYEYDGRQGRRSLQQAIVKAGAASEGEAFEVLATNVADFVGDLQLDKKQGWYLQSLRQILQTLLANPACRSEANKLAMALRAVNQAQKDASL